MFIRLYPRDRLLEIPISSHHFDFITKRFAKSEDTSEVEGNMSEKRSRLTLSAKSLAGPGYIILNGIRVMNIVSLLAAIAASVVMLAKVSTSTSMFFFDALSHIVTAVSSIFLIISELSLFQQYFARQWPLLSPNHGFVTLAIAMIVLGITLMGNLNKDAGNRERLGLPFWRMVISSGILVFTLGWINLIASYIFRDRRQGITARQVRAHGAVAAHQTPVSSQGTPSAPVLAQSYISAPEPTTPTKFSNPFRILTGDRRNSPMLPSYHTASGDNSPVKPDPVSPTSKYSRTTNCNKKQIFSGIFSGRNNNRNSLAPPLPINTSHLHGREMEISAPQGVNPQFAHLVQRPDSALHPSRTGESENYRWKLI